MTAQLKSATWNPPHDRAIFVANFVGVTKGERYGERSLREAAQGAGRKNGNRARLILGSEADDVDADNRTEPLDLDEWQVIHKEKNEDRDGSLIAFQREFVKLVGKPRWIKISKAVHGEVGDRYRLCVDLKGWCWTGEKTFAAVHFAPPRTPKARADGAQRMVTSTDVDVFGGDFNLRKTAVKDRYPGAQVRTSEVINLVSRTKDVRLGTGIGVKMQWSDHPGLWVPIS